MTTAAKNGTKAAQIIVSCSRIVVHSSLAKPGRVSEEWAGKVISRIGKEAGIVVNPESNDNSAKFASAHDLRRSCADRMAAAGVPERDITAFMRHASELTTRRHYTPGNVQRSAAA